MDVIFDKGSLKVTGFDRSPGPFEFEVKDVPEGVSKEVPVPAKVEKVDEEGVRYFYFQEPTKEVVIKEERKEVTTEETAEKVMETVYEKSPLLNDKGEQVRYEIMEEKFTPEERDPETGEVIQEEKRELVGTGVFRECFTNAPKEVQKKDSEGNPLFYKTVVEERQEEVEGEVIEIPETDERYTEGLSPVLVDVEPKMETVTLKNRPHLFTYEEVLAEKYLRMLNASDKDEIIVEDFRHKDPVDFNYANHNGTVGNGFITLPPGGRVKTIAFKLSGPKFKFEIFDFDADSGVELRNGNTLVEKELSLDKQVEEISFIFINKTEETKQVRTLAFGY